MGLEIYGPPQCGRTRLHNTVTYTPNLHMQQDPEKLTIISLVDTFDNEEAEMDKMEENFAREEVCQMCNLQKLAFFKTCVHAISRFLHIY